MFGRYKRSSEFLNYPVVSGNVSFYNGTNKKYLYRYWWCRLDKKLTKPIGHNFKKENSAQ